jgi:hypothetical protein
MKEERVLIDTQVCLFCGKNLNSEHIYIDHDDMHGHWHYFCDCEDFLEHERITAEIKKLEKQLPEEKYTIEKRKVLYKIK